MHIVQGLMYVVLYVGIRYLVNTFVGGGGSAGLLYGLLSPRLAVF